MIHRCGVDGLMLGVANWNFPPKKRVFAGTFEVRVRVILHNQL